MRILHVFRTPVGGLFRHVRDLARGQRGMGHDAGIICDSTTGGDTAHRLLDEVEQHCSLGVKRIPISRMPGLGDISGVRQTIAHARAIGPDVIHCHGAKGGLYGRIAARYLGIPSVYTPHGGSLHYRWMSPAGAVFLGAEWLLAAAGGGIHFVCRYEHDSFDGKIGIGSKLNCIIYNGLWPEEFGAAVPAPDAADILFIGDMRHLKGVDILLHALALCNRHRRVTACLVGDGPDLNHFKTLADNLQLKDQVSFPGRLTAADAFKRGRLLVMPSRAESFPYVVLEALAAEIPLIASNVGGIPEVLPSSHLFPAENAPSLAKAIDGMISDPARMRHDAAAAAAKLRIQFSAEAMVKDVVAFYRRAALK